MLELNIYSEVRFVLYEDLSSCGALIYLSCLLCFFSFKYVYSYIDKESSGKRTTFLYFSA